MKARARKLLVLTATIFISCGTAISHGNEYEVVAKLPKDIPPGNIAVSQTGRIFLSVHDFFPSDLRLVELHRDGGVTPFPNEQWATSPAGENAPGIQSVLGLNTDDKYQRLFGDSSLAWPDGFATGPDGYIYATINELHRSPVLNGGENVATGEFKVIRFKPLADVTIGR